MSFTDDDLSAWEAHQRSRQQRRREARLWEPHWLYRLYDADGELLYIGQTYRPARRISYHKSRARSDFGSDWFLDVCRAEWQRYPDYDAVLWAEREAIKAERPRYNVVHNLEAAS